MCYRTALISYLSPRKLGLPKKTRSRSRSRPVSTPLQNPLFFLLQSSRCENGRRLHKQISPQGSTGFDWDVNLGPNASKDHEILLCGVAVDINNVWAGFV